MRTTFSVVAMFLASSLAGGLSAIAQVADDTMGLVFDLDANWPYHQDQLFVATNAYLVLILPTDSELFGFEAAVRSTDGEVIVISPVVSGGGVDSLEDLNEFAVTFDTPLPTSTVTVLAELQVLPIHEDECIVLTGVSRPSLDSEFPLIWTTRESPRAIETYDIFANGVDAVVAGWVSPVLYDPYPPPCSGVVAVSNSNWGAVKARYR